MFGKIGGLGLIQAPPRSKLVIRFSPPVNLTCTLLREKFLKETNYHITYSQLTHLKKIGGVPDGTSGKEPACQCRRHRRCGFDPWVRKIP